MANGELGLGIIAGHRLFATHVQVARILVLQKPIEVDALKSVFVRSVAIPGAATASPERRMVG